LAVRVTTFRETLKPLGVTPESVTRLPTNRPWLPLVVTVALATLLAPEPERRQLIDRLPTFAGLLLRVAVIVPPAGVGGEIGIE
jgi:hypothetical protein